VTGRSETIEVTAARSLTDVPEGEWDALVGDRSFYLTHAWLRAQDTGQPVSATYLLASSGGGQLMGVLPIYRVERETNAFYQPERCADGRWRGRYLIAGTRRAYANGVPVAAGLTATCRAEITAHLLTRVRAEASAAGSDGALFLYLPTPEAVGLREASSRLRPVLTSMEAVLDLPGTAFEDYLQSLSGHRRRVVKHEMAAFSRAGLTILAEPVTEIWEQAAPLLAGLQRRYGDMAPLEHWRQLLRRQACALGKHAMFFTCRDAGTLVGFCLCYQRRGVLYLKLCGFDYARLGGRFEYFNLVYYGPIRYAYEHSLTRIHFGREAFTAKLSRGARLAPLWSIEVPTSGRPASADAAAWNRRTVLNWRAELGPLARGLRDPGWSYWGCDAGEQAG
jgi:predicted N-acyltransferase